MAELPEREKRRTKKLRGVAYKCEHCGATEWRVSRSGNWVCTQCNQPVAVEEFSWTGDEVNEDEPPPKEGRKLKLAKKSAAKKPEPRTREESYSYYTESEPAPSPDELRHRSPESEEDRENRSRRNRPAAPAASGPVDTSRNSSRREEESRRREEEARRRGTGPHR